MFDIQEELKKLPDKPGVYIMKDQSGTVIYVGKAAVLKNRVRQYFQSSRNHTPKTVAMVGKIVEFEYIVTGTEVEALMLECNLIKKYRPRYNILLKDDKSYPYIKVTMNEEYPRLLIVRRKEQDGARYFGPYASGLAVKETLAVIRRLFPVKNCALVLPRDIGKTRPCLNYFIFQCLAPCQGDVNREAYYAMMKDICTFLAGRQEEIIQKLENRMQQLAEQMEFERAAELRDKIVHLKSLTEKQKVTNSTAADEDIIALARSATNACIQVYFVRSGKLLGREHFILDETSETQDGDLIYSFIEQFYDKAAYIPSEIAVMFAPSEEEVLAEFLSEKREGKVHLKVPKRGDKLQLMELAQKNAELMLSQHEERLQSEGAFYREGFEKLPAAAGLDTTMPPPERIEAYDISNTGESEIVASMVVFTNGLPDNHEYRRFRIKSTETQNDYQSMYETLTRRFARALKGDNAFNKLPGLVLIDGGQTHTAMAKQVLAEMGFSDIPVRGMVKDDKHRTRGLVWADGSELDLRKGDIQLLRFVTAVQDEAHRFALAYNKQLRGKRQIKSALDEIEGIGPKKKKALLRELGSVRRIRECSVEELQKVEGISASLAEKIYDHFH